MFGLPRGNSGAQTPLNSIDRPLTRIELHVHLDGAVRHETIYELSKAKNLPLPGQGTFEELVDYLVIKNPGTLESFLSRFDVILASIKGDFQALERIGFEFVQDCSKHGIIYAEARFCPHILIPEEILQGEQERCMDWVYSVTNALIKGLIKGQEQYKSKVYLIATCIRGMSPNWFTQTLQLLIDKDFHQGRVCGVDLAALPTTSCESHMLGQDALALFDQALKYGIHRTVHAGESGGPFQVSNALDVLHAERIGHGYRIVDDDQIYQRIRMEGVHLECCPWSSLLTGSVGLGEHPHPVVKFFRDGFNVSVSTDDPAITGTRIGDEYRLLRKWGLCEAHFVKGNLNAARSCFLPEQEKKDLYQTLGKNYGFVDQI